MVRILFCSMHTRYILPCPDLDHFQFASLLRPQVSLWALTESSPTPRNDVPLVVAGASVPPMTGSGRHIGFTVFHAHKTSMSQELRQLRQLRSWLWDPYGLRSKVSGYGFGTELVPPLGMLCVLSKFMNYHECNGLSHCFSRWQVCLTLHPPTQCPPNFHYYFPFYVSHSSHVFSTYIFSHYIHIFHTIFQFDYTLSFSP